MGQAQGFDKFGCCAPDPDMKPEPVTLNIYDLHGNDRSIFKGINVLLRAAGTGAFHVGLEVFDREWSFGYRDDSATGVFCHAPRESELHSYRQSISMGDTDLTQNEVAKLMKKMSLGWKGDSYDMMTRNCCHFCDELCRDLHVDRPSFVEMPEWISTLFGAALADAHKPPALDNSPDMDGKSSRKRASVSEDTSGKSSRGDHGRSTSRKSEENRGLSISIELKW